MAHIEELIKRAVFEIKTANNCNNDDYIRKEKCILIDDCFRVMKASIPLNAVYYDLINSEWWQTFCALYDLSIEDLELLLARLSAELKNYMVINQRQSMSASIYPNWVYLTGRNPNTFRKDSPDCD
jgi:hypothetical protein